MTECTNREKRNIARAYSLLYEHADCRDHSAGEMFRTSLRSERHERSSITVAKALMLRSFLEGFDEPDKPLHTLYTLAAALRPLTLYGTYCAHHVRAPDAALLTDIREACSMHEQAIQRAFEASKTQTTD